MIKCRKDCGRNGAQDPQGPTVEVKELPSGMACWTAPDRSFAVVGTGADQDDGAAGRADELPSRGSHRLREGHTSIS